VHHDLRGKPKAAPISASPLPKLERNGCQGGSFAAPKWLAGAENLRKTHKCEHRYLLKTGNGGP